MTAPLPNPFISATPPAESLAVAPSDACMAATASVDYDALWPPEPLPLFIRTQSDTLKRLLFELSK